MKRGLISNIIAVLCVLLLIPLFYVSWTSEPKNLVLLGILVPVAIIIASILCFRNIFTLEKGVQRTISKIVLWIPIAISLFVTGYLFWLYLRWAITFLTSSKRVSADAPFLIYGALYFLFVFGIWIAEGIFIIKFDKDDVTKLGKVVTIITSLILYGFTALAGYALMGLPHITMGTYGTPLYRCKKKR